MGSDFLFAMPSMVSGLARTLDLGGTFDEYNDSPNGDIADWLASLADWRSIGAFLASAMNDVGETPRNDEAGIAEQSV